MYSQARRLIAANRGSGEPARGNRAAERRMKSRTGANAAAVTRNRQNTVASGRAAVEASLPAGHVPPQITIASDISGNRRESRERESGMGKR